MSIVTASVGAVEVPAYEDLIARGYALVPDIAARAARCESDCLSADEVIE